MSPFVRHPEAFKLIQTTQDPRRKAMMQLALTTALARVPIEDGAPPFDLEQCVRVASAMYDQAEAVRTILDGDVKSLSWWDDDEPIGS